MRDIEKIEIKELVQLLNKALKDNISVNKFCSNNGLKGSSVKTRLRKEGYSYDSDLRAYVKTTKDEIKSGTIINSKDRIKDDTRIKHLEQQLKKLEERVNKLESSMSKNKKNSSKKGKYYINNTRDTTTKGIRLYTEVKEQLDDYLDTHKDKKVIEVFSYAILDYINKYK